MFSKNDNLLATQLTQSNILFPHIKDEMETIGKDVLLRNFQSMNIGGDKYNIQHHWLGRTV